MCVCVCVYVCVCVCVCLHGTYLTVCCCCFIHTCIQTVRDEYQQLRQQAYAQSLELESLQHYKQHADANNDSTHAHMMNEKKMMIDAKLACDSVIEKLKLQLAQQHKKNRTMSERVAAVECEHRKMSDAFLVEKSDRDARIQYVEAELSALRESTQLTECKLVEALERERQGNVCVCTLTLHVSVYLCLIVCVCVCVCLCVCVCICMYVCMYARRHLYVHR